MVSNRNNVTDREILDVALESCRGVVEEMRQGAIAMEALESGRRPPLGTMPESLLLRTVELAGKAIALADSRPAESAATDNEIMREALAACRCVLARQQEIDEVLESLETGSPIPAGSMETTQSQLGRHAAKALELANSGADAGSLNPPRG